MNVVETSKELRKAGFGRWSEGRSVGFVPTMGALHEGHLSLIRQATQENDATVVSIFVNPTQFGPKEDFSSYPRKLEQDLALAESAGASWAFIPTEHEVYPAGFSTFVDETRFSQALCGPFRPGHFRGVCTVVSKFLQLVTPDRLYLGQKDAQQVRVLMQMIRDMHFPVTVVRCPTVREADGLAMSSRNAYLSSEERSFAPTIYKSLSAAQNAFEEGERSVKKIQSIVQDSLKSSGAFEIQYVDLLRWNDFHSVEAINEESILAVSAYLGKTRLIDNIFLKP